MVIFVLKSPENPVKKMLRDLFYGEVVLERIVEYPVFFSLTGYKGKSEKRKVLDVGCYYSNFPIQLASMGFKVWGIDPEPYQLIHPNFTFIQGDVTKTDFKSGFFDIVTSVSTIEHIGLGFYKDKNQNSGDTAAVEEISRILKKGGLFVLSVPYSKSFRLGKTQRFYDTKHINILLSSKFKITNRLLYASYKGKWMPVDEDKVWNTRGETTSIVAIITATKK